jgi:hypothetical protein
MATNTEAAAIQARRKAAAKAPPPAPPTTPVTVGAGEPARHYEALGDPREPRVQVGTISDGNHFSRPHPLAAPREVAEATGWSMDRADSDDFVVAECDVYETILPKGCTTPTSRMRWAKGQHVPVEVYRAWQAEHAATLEAAPVAPPPDPPAN